MTLLILTNIDQPTLRFVVKSNVFTAEIDVLRPSRRLPPNIPYCMVPPRRRKTKPRLHLTVT